MRQAIIPGKLRSGRGTHFVKRWCLSNHSPKVGRSPGEQGYFWICLLLLLATLILTGCTGIISSSDSVEPRLASISISPSGETINKGAILQFTATGTFTDGSTQKLLNSVTWASSIPSVATISSSGTATGLGVGNTSIEVSSGPINASVTLTVTAAMLVSIAVTPSAPTIAKGATQQFTATGSYSDNSQQNITSTVTWASATQSVATIGANTGLASGVGAGTSQITATLGSVASPPDTLTVTAATLVSIAVTPSAPTIAKGATQQFTATGSYSDNSQQNITSTVTWASATQSVATIGANTGLASGVGAGTSQIMATLGSVASPPDTLTVTAATLVSIAVTPSAPTIAKGATQQFTATGSYSDNSQQNITSTVTWASATPSVATIGANTGLASGVGAGTSQITATLGSVASPPDTLTVTAATLVSIAVTPSAPTIAKGATQQFTATGSYSDNSQQNITSTVTWASATQSVATIGTNTGLARVWRGHLADHGDVGQRGQSAGHADGDGGDTGFDRGDAVGSHDRQGRNATIHGHGHLQRQQPAEHHQHSDLGFGDAVGGDHWRQHGLGQRCRRGHIADHGDVGQRGKSTGHADGDGGDTGVDRGDAVDPTIAKGRRSNSRPRARTATAAAKPDQHGDVGFGDAAVATIANTGLASGVARAPRRSRRRWAAWRVRPDTLTVTAATLVSIAVTPANPSIAKGATQQFTATGTYSDNTRRTSPAR